MQVISLQKGLDQAVVLDPTDDNLDRVTAKQLKIKFVGRQALHTPWTNRGGARPTAVTAGAVTEAVGTAACWP